MLGHRAIGEGPLSALLVGSLTQTQALTARYASQSFVTRSTDSPAHEFIEGRITRGLRLARRLTQAEGGQFGALIETDFGEIYLLNNDGALDQLVDRYYADGRTIRLKIGATEITSSGREQVKPYSSFATVYTSVAEEWSFEHDIVRLRIRDLSNRLKDRLQQKVYAGTGGKQGTANMAGLTAPTAFGRCLNISALLVDPAILSYQLHSGRMNSITAVYDAGVVVPFDADYANYDALTAASVPAGSYASCIAEGFIRLGVVSVGMVTADIRGHQSDVGYFDDHGAVMTRILLDFASFPETDINLLSFEILDGIEPNSMALFLPAGDQSSVEEVLEQIAFSAGAFIGQDRSGLLRVKRLDIPKDDPDWTFTDRDIVSIDRLALPYGVPWKAWGVSYQPNWTQQTGGDLASGVSSARRQFVQSDRRFVYAQDSGIAIAHRTSSGAPLRLGLFLDPDAAQEEAQRLIDFYSLGRAMYEVRVKTALFSIELGQTVRLVYDRWNLSNGQNFVAVDIDDDADSIMTTLKLFGGGLTEDHDFDVEAAFQAKAAGDQNYFANVLPDPILSTGLAGAPVPPSQRGWTALSYPSLSGLAIGSEIRNVLVPLGYPLESTWNDPNPTTNSVAGFIGQAPDGSIAIERRFTSGNTLSFISAFIPLVGTDIGFKHAGAKLEVWTQAGFNWGPNLTGGKVAGGLWGGGRKSVGLVEPWDDQDGVTVRNIWSSNGAGTVNARMYAYIQNRPLSDGEKTPNVTGQWLTGQWQTLEYEGFINDLGKANGYARMWINGVLVGEVQNAIWALGRESMWRGIVFDDAWQDGAVPQDQKRWIRNLTFYHP